MKLATGSYLEEKLRKARALEWDRKDSQLVEEFRKKRQELLLRNQALKELQAERQDTALKDIKTRRE